MKPMEIKLRSEMSHWPKILQRYEALGARGFLSDFLGEEAKPVQDLVLICAPPYFQTFRHPCHLLWAWCTLSKNLNFTITLPTTMASLLETSLDLYNCRNLDKVRILIFFHYYGSLLIFLGFKNKRNILPDSAFGA